MKENISCLLVDDDQDDQEIFVMALKRVSETIDCRIAGNGVEALNILQSGMLTPDYIFIDINMPKMNGILCLEKMKELEIINRSKVFIYSTTADPGILQQSNGLGAGFIIKPNSIRELEAALAAVFTD